MHNVSPVLAVLLTGLIGCGSLSCKVNPFHLFWAILFLAPYLRICLCVCLCARWEVIVQTESIPSSQDNFHSHVQSARSPKSCTGQFSSKSHEQENSALIWCIGPKLCKEILRNMRIGFGKLKNGIIGRPITYSTVGHCSFKFALFIVVWRRIQEVHNNWECVGTLTLTKSSLSRRAVNVNVKKFIFRTYIWSLFNYFLGL